MGNPKVHGYSRTTAEQGRITLCGAVTSRVTFWKREVTCLMCKKMIRKGTKPKM